MVEFKNKIYTELLFQDSSSDDDTLHTYEYATVKSIRDHAQNLLAPPSIQSIGVDTNNDGIYE